jgi:Anti-sigma-K factor rskA, C-terminal
MTAMDHGAAHELIEDLLLDPARLAALPSSSAPRDVALREHLDGCAACRADLEGWSRLQSAVSDALAAEEPGEAARAVEPLEAPPSLRARVLAAVRADVDSELAPVAMSAVTRGTVAPTAMSRGWLDRPKAAWLGLAAALVLAVGAAGLAIDQASRLATAGAESRSLTGAMAAVDRILSSDHKVVPLQTTSGAAAGTISWSRHDWVVLTTALAAPPAGRTYFCWLEADGRSVPVGRMDFADGTAYWVATVDEWQTWEIGPTTQFVVSLESGDPAARSGDAILSANLGT